MAFCVAFTDIKHLSYKCDDCIVLPNLKSLIDPIAVTIYTLQAQFNPFLPRQIDVQVDAVVYKSTSAPKLSFFSMSRTFVYRQ